MSAALTDTRVVAITGARQVGKSTLVHRLTRNLPGVRRASLDLSADGEAATADPEAFVRHDGLMVIDEI